MFCRRVMIALVAAAALACADLKDLMSLQQGLAAEFQTPAVSVNLSNTAYLTVVFSNSAIADSSEAAQSVFARHVAEYVRDHYPHYDQLQSIQVGFASVKGVGITFTSTRIPYRFAPSDLGPAQQPKIPTMRKAAV